MGKEYRVPACATVVQRSAVRTDVERVIIHAGVTAIEAEAFRGWTGLREVVFEAGADWAGSGRTPSRGPRCAASRRRRG